MGCFVRGGKNGIGCFVRDDKNCMGCFVRDGKLMRDVLSGVAKNGMGCFVLHSNSLDLDQAQQNVIRVCALFREKHYILEINKISKAENTLITILSSAGTIYKYFCKHCRLSMIWVNTVCRSTGHGFCWKIEHAEHKTVS